MPKMGEEKRRTCPVCKATTWQTYVSWFFANYGWECNQCGHRQKTN